MSPIVPFIFGTISAGLAGYAMNSIAGGGAVFFGFWTIAAIIETTTRKGP